MRVEELAEHIKDIPTLPLVARQIAAESSTDTFSSKTLGAIIEKDPPLTAKLLRLANSAYYGFARQVTTLERAVTLLGFNTVRNLAMTVSISNLFGAGHSGVDMKGLWHHCLGTAIAAKALIRHRAADLEEETFLCGIIHDIGAIILLNNFPDKMVEALEAKGRKKISQSEAEKQSLGINHEEAGAFLAEKWNFPVAYYRVVRLHHRPPDKTVPADDRDNLLVMAVYAGNQLAKAAGLGMSLDQQTSGVIQNAWKTFGIAPSGLKGLRENIKEDFEQVRTIWEED